MSAPVPVSIIPMLLAFYVPMCTPSVRPTPLPRHARMAELWQAIDLRVLLEPLFVKYGVQVAFSGHDHIYERLKPQEASCTSSRVPLDSFARATCGGRK